MSELKSVEDIIDPNHEVTESGTYTNYARNQYEFWDIDENGDRNLCVISDMNYPTEEHSYSEFRSTVDEIKKIYYYYEAGMLGNFNPGENEEIYDEEGNYVDTQFTEYFVH